MHFECWAFREHGLIKDGLCGGEDKIIGGAHENPSFASWGSTQVGHQFGLWGEFVCAHFSRDEDICSAAKDPKMVY